MLAAGPPEDSPIADAAMRGDLDAVRILIGAGEDVNAPQGDGMTALHWASERGDEAIASLLVAQGASVGTLTRMGAYQPLHLASRRGSATVVRLLLEAGADVAATTSPGQTTPLHLAALAGDASTVALLLADDAEVDAREDAWGQTPLMFAASQNRVEVIRSLLAAGADPFLTTRVQGSEAAALDRAVSQKRSAVLAELTDSGAVEATPEQIQAAIAAGRMLYVTGFEPPEEEEPAEEEVIERRPAPASGIGGLTALLHAIRQGHLSATIALIEGGADVNQAADYHGTPPLLMATINGQFDIAMLLLERGADPNGADEVNGVAPLWAAVNARWQPRTRFPQPQEQGFQKETYLGLMEALIKAGADPDHRTLRHPFYMVFSGCGNGNCGLEDTRSSTAFWRAAYATDVSAMRLLASYGANPDLPTVVPPDTGGGRRGGGGRGGGRGSTREDLSGLPPVVPGDPVAFPIHAASGIGYGEGYAGNSHRHVPGGWLPSVRYLIEELGADVNSRDNNGYSPLHHAAARGDIDLILFLIDRGADPTLLSRRGQTVADMANGPVSRISPYPLAVTLLEKLGSKNNHRCASC